MKTLLISIGMAMMLAGCNKQKEVDALSGPSLWEANAKERVKNNLKDPSSAEFKDVMCWTQIECKGFVNAKNTFGGYVGYRKFTIFPDASVYIEND